MFLSVVLMIMLQLVLVSNKETSCGCNVDRCDSEKDGKSHLFSDQDRNQCSVPDSKNNILEDFSEDSEDTEEMVLVPAGLYQFGTDEIIIENDKEGPKRTVKLNSFYLDKYEVSNREYRRFVESTGYKTEAETFGDSFVFLLFLNDTSREKLKDFRVVQAPWWYKVSGADWRHPHGPDSNLEGLLDHPVIHLSWRDANAYCKWKGRRLPSEAEWEAACRGGHQDIKYPWGDKVFPDRKHMANIWQGTFPNHNSAKDGYVGTNPVHLYPQNDFGLYNMAGNVWEWTQDSWTEDNPKEKVKKGGSYLCHRSYCYRYRCSARSHNTEDSSAGNLGFRCAKSM